MLIASIDVIPVGESPQLTSAIKAFTVLTREQKSALARTLDGFVDCLAVETASEKVREVITEHAWHNRANWEDDDWEIWETWGWYRHWGRTVGALPFRSPSVSSNTDWFGYQYSPYLRNYMNTIGTVAFAKVPSKADPAVELFRKTWNIATGQEV